MPPLVALLWAASCSSAGAFTFELSAGDLNVVAAAGETNSFDVQDLAGGIVVLDHAQNPMTSPLPAGCSSAVPWEVSCDPGLISRVSINAGDGNDSLFNGSVLASVSLSGGAGNDEISGGAGSESLRGDDGNDAIHGGDGGDMIDGGEGADELIGADGDDTIIGGAGDDRLDGSDGNDVSDGGVGADTLTGGDGNDSLAGGGGNDHLSGDDGADTLLGSEGDDLLDGGRGADALDGAEGGDELVGGEGADRLSGGNGIDRLSGGEGNDELAGQAGGDTLAGGDGDDRLDGGADGDSLDGDAGSDRLNGGDGDDVLIGGDGSDDFFGGTGSDLVSYAAQTAPLRLSIDDVADDGSDGERDNVRTDVEQLLAGAGPDRLIGSARAERLDGGGGDDLIDGGLGPDVLVGGDGTDTVTYATRRGRVLAKVGAGSGGEPGERDTIDLSIENLTGGGGADRLSGAAGVVNVLVGGAGDDLLLVANDGGETDQAVCGAGADRVSKDRRDIVAVDCERVRTDGTLVRPAPAPRVFIGARRLRIDASRRVGLGLRCAAATDRICAGSVRLTHRRDGRGPAFATGRFRVAPRTSDTVQLRLSRSAAGLVGRSDGRRLRAWARVRVRDASGKASVRSVRVALLADNVA